MAAEDAIDFQAIFAATPASLMVLSRDLKIVDASDRYARLLRRDRGDLIGCTFPDVVSSGVDETERVKSSVRQVVETGLPDTIPFVCRTPSPARSPSGRVSARAEADRWTLSHTPIKGPGGAVRLVLQHQQGHGPAPDVTANVAAGWGPDSLGTSLLHRAERVEALNVSLLAESAQLRNLFNRAPSFMCLLRGPDYHIELANLAFTDLVGERQLVGRSFRDAIPEADGQLYLDLLDEVFASGEPFVGKQMRAEFQRTPGQGPEEVFISFVLQPIIGDDRKVIAIFVDGNDVTDHVRAERSQALLVRELHHRVRNTLATVQGVMNSTARTAETIEDYQWAFSGRISSLARTHSLLTEEIQQFVSFSHLLRQEIGVYAEGETDRVVLEGPDVELPSQLAVPLGMTIHELATNAYRHGSLSTPEGRVTVTWSIMPAKEKRILICRWIETGGPPVTPPARHGFGSMILTRVLSQQIGAKVDATYQPDGFELSADIPLVIERV